MGALVLADPGGGTRSGSRRRYAVPALLVAGWVGLFAYSAAYLTEDMPFRNQAAGTGQSSDPSPVQQTARRVVLLDAPVRDAPDAPPAARPAPAVPTTAPAQRPARAPAPPSAEYVGIWGPTPDACGSGARRRGYIPATITPDRARAGHTLCAFHDLRRTGNAWVASAECRDRRRHWSSLVRLTVDGDRLTWSSGRGTATYVRCSRRPGEDGSR